MLERWGFPLIAFIVAVVLMPTLRDGAVTPKWAALAALLPWLLFARRPHPTPAHWCGIILLGWAAYSLLWSTSWMDGLNELIHLGLFACVFLIAAEIDDPRRTMIAFVSGVAISGALALLQAYGFDLIPQSAASPAGLFGNRNYLAEAGVMAVALALGLHLWKLLPFAAAAALAPLSRAAFLGVAVVLGLWVWHRSPRLAMALACVGVLAGTGVMLDRGAPAWLAKRDSLDVRLGIWKPTLDGMKLAGNGIGSFVASYPVMVKFADDVNKRPEHAHNEYLNFAFELGLPAVLLGVVLFGALLAPIGYAPGAEAARLGLAGFAAVAVFGFPLHLPATGFAAALLAGHLWGRWHRLRDLNAGWRSASESRHARLRSSYRAA